MVRVSSQLPRLLPLLFLPSVILRFQSEYYTRPSMLIALTGQCQETCTVLERRGGVINLVFLLFVALMKG